MNDTTEIVCDSEALNENANLTKNFTSYFCIYCNIFSSLLYKTIMNVKQFEKWIKDTKARKMCNKWYIIFGV